MGRGVTVAQVAKPARSQENAALSGRFGATVMRYGDAAKVVMTSFFQMPTHSFAPPRGIPHHDITNRIRFHPFSFSPSVLQFFSPFP
jgi:hypothetical protein